jgi:replication factor C large subunit
MPWTEKYRPVNFEDIKGQESSLKQIREFVENFKKGRKKAILLNGGPGVGKTTIAHVIANESNSEIFELNASDLRNKKKLDEILKPALEQKSLFSKGKLILVDEVDGITGQDRGGVTELIRLIQDSYFPIIMTANDAWAKKLSPLRKKVEMVDLKPINTNTIIDVLMDILRKESLFLNQNILRSIAERAQGDLRASINDLQAASRMRDPSSMTFDSRNKKIDIFHALKKVLQKRPNDEMLRIYDGVDMNIDEIILWAEENIPIEYSGTELARAMDLLSKVDVFRGRIFRKQYWRFLAYENIFLSYGISSAKKKEINKFTSYKKPSRILKIWLNNQRTLKKKSICIKYASHVHVGIKRAQREFPIIKEIINSNPSIAKELKLSVEEIDYLKKEITNSNF